MKKLHFTGLAFMLLSLWIILSSSSGGRATSANTGNTGAPSETSTCASCHSGGNYGTVSLSIQLFQAGTTTTVTSYTGGTTYDMRVTVNHTSGTPAGHGFQLTCLTQGSNTPLAGYSNLASNVKQKTITSGIYSGRTYCEHNGVVASNQFNFSWTAPAVGTGTVVFYSAGNCVNGTGGDNGDKAGNTSLTVTEAVALAASGTVTNVDCNGATTGAINLSATGGTAPYTYSWNDGITTEDRAGLAAGNYTVTITATGGATTTNSFTITQPTQLVGNISAGTIACSGGSTTVSVSAAGGTQPYTNTGTFTVVAGQHSYTIADAKGCTANVSVTVSEPQALSASATNANIPCTGGSATVTVSATGGTQPYTGTGAMNVTTPGTYNYTVTDNNGCTATANAIVNATDGFTATDLVGRNLCYGTCENTVDLSITGGAAPFTYAWSNGQSTSSVSGLCAGNYSVSISDANNCTVVNNYSFAENDSLVINLGAIVSSSGSDGAIDIGVNGGAAPYTYAWSNSSTNEDQADLAAGIYSVTVTDNSNCSATAAFTVDFVSGINELKAGKLMLYPNPATQVLNFTIQGKQASVSIVNIQGETVYMQQYVGNGIYSVNIGSLPAAVYYLKATGQDYVQIGSFVKQ